MQGTVVNYNRQQGWGFIRPDDTDVPDCFVRFKWIQAPTKFERFLKPGQRVDFIPAELDVKPQAHDVRVIPPITIARQTSDPTVQS